MRESYEFDNRFHERHVRSVWITGIDDGVMCGVTHPAGLRYRLYNDADALLRACAVLAANAALNDDCPEFRLTWPSYGRAHLAHRDSSSRDIVRRHKVPWGTLARLGLAEEANDVIQSSKEELPDI